MKPAKLFRRWRNQQIRLLANLVDLVPRARKRGSREDIHELRVTTRRLRLLTRLGAAWYGEALSHSYRDWARTIAGATDPIRDADVALEWIEQQPGSARVVRAVERLRSRTWRRRRTRMDPPPALLVDALATWRGGAKRGTRLLRRCDRFQQRLRDVVLRTAPGLFRLPPEEQHNFRRLVRRWRYLRELELPDRRHRKDARLKQLLRLQETLGDRQNLLLADGVLASLTPWPEVRSFRRRLTAEIRACADSIQRQIRTLD